MSKAKQSVTINTIACHLGVSNCTVSHVLNGQDKKRKISKATALRVKRTANKLGYVPNQLARSLRRGKTGTVSLVFTDLIGGWAHEIVSGVYDVFQSLNNTPIISLYDRSRINTHGLGGIGRKQVESILQRRDEALLCQPVEAARGDYLKLIDAGVNVVFIGSILEDMVGLERVHSVTWDCGPAAETIMRHLISSGCRKIAFIGVKHGVDSDIIRFNAYRKCLAEAGLPVRDEWEIWSDSSYRFDRECAVSELRSIFDGEEEKPDAIFTINDSIAVTVLEAFRAMGIRGSEDIVVAGMGNLAVTRFSPGNLVTVTEPLFQIGQVAAETFLELNEHDSLTSVHKKISCNGICDRRS